MTALIVTGTDTGIGKTIVAAMLTLALDGIYWKPIQSGLEDGTDRDRVAALTGLTSDRFRPEAYRLTAPLSPHRAAELDGIQIDPDQLALPADIPHGRTLIVEGAGGVLVPVTRALLQIALFARWKAPAIVVARTMLGTINHSLLTIAALRAHGVPVVGLVFVGEENADSEHTIVEMGGVKRLGRLPILPHPDKDSLARAFTAHFSRHDFETADAR